MANGDGTEARSIAVRFLEAIASRDCDRILELCADQVVFEWPMVNGRITDPEIFRAQVAPVLAPMEGLAFHDVVIDDMSSPSEVTLRYRGSATMSTTGKPYRQTYITQIHVEAGKVTLFREYYNPTALAEALTPDSRDAGMVSMPAGINAAFAAGYNSRDVEALAALYEHDAVVTNPDGSIAVGIDAIRVHLGQLVELGGFMTSRNRYAIPNGDLALVGADWEIDFKDGRERVAGRSAEVVRRQPDDSWRYVLDHPGAG